MLFVLFALLLIDYYLKRLTLISNEYFKLRLFITGAVCLIPLALYIFNVKNTLNSHCLILAAGKSRRFGSQKLLYPLVKQEPMLITTVKNCLKVFEQVSVIIPTDDTELRSLLHQYPVNIVDNPDRDLGMSASIKHGLRDSDEVNAYIIMLADMPLVKTETLAQINQALFDNNHAISAAQRIVVPFYNGTKGNPVAFGCAYKDELLSIEGDKGARELIKKYSQYILAIDSDDVGITLDIDDQAALSRALAELEQ